MHDQGTAHAHPAIPNPGADASCAPSQPSLRSTQTESDFLVEGTTHAICKPQTLAQILHVHEEHQI